jgi:hypothetical protein
MTWYEIGEVLGLADVAMERGSTLAEAAFEYAADRSDFRWTCPGCGELISDRGASTATRPRSSRDMPRAAIGGRSLSVSGWPRATDRSRVLVRAPDPRRLAPSNPCHDHAHTFLLL